jgi:pimeloyl-ACP methyl ester carboxylesterase
MILNYNQHKIYYEIHGEGKPLIVLNGIMMSTMSWHQYLSALKNYQIILVDFLDQGQSSDGELYKHDIQVDIIRTLVDCLKLSETNILGISYGAQIALQYAIKYDVNQLMICNAALYTTPWLSDIGQAWSLAASKNDPELFFHVTIPYIYSHQFYNKNYGWISKRKETLLSVFNQPFMKRMMRLVESSESYDIRASVRNISAKTHVLSAEYDYLTPADETYEIYKSISHATHINLKECGHASMYEKPEAFISEITRHFV